MWFLLRLTEPTITQNTRFALLLSLMLAQRSGRIVQMRWIDIDLEDAIWDRSGQFEKNNNPIAIPLSEDVLNILKYLRERQVQKVVANDPERWAKARCCQARGNMFFPGVGSPNRRRSPRSIARCGASTTRM